MDYPEKIDTFIKRLDDLLYRFIDCFNQLETCCNCGSLKREDQIQSTEIGGELFLHCDYCEEDVISDTFVCESCGDRYFLGQECYAEGDYYCGDCFDEQYTYCENCDEAKRRTDMVEFGGCDMCKDCFLNMMEDYSNKNLVKALMEYEIEKPFLRDSLLKWIINLRKRNWSCPCGNSEICPQTNNKHKSSCGDCERTLLYEAIKSRANDELYDDIEIGDYLVNKLTKLYYKMYFLEDLVR